MPREVSIRFNSADKLTWEPVSDGHMDQAMDDTIDLALVVERAISDHIETEEALLDWSGIDGMHAGDVAGVHEPVALFLYSMEDDEWVYIAHFIYEVTHQCFLFRHRKEKHQCGI